MGAFPDRLNPFYVGDNSSRRVVVDGEGTIHAESIVGIDPNLPPPAQGDGLGLRRGYVILPDCPDNPEDMEFGSICKCVSGDSAGKILIKDASGVREL